MGEALGGTAVAQRLCCEHPGLELGLGSIGVRAEPGKWGPRTRCPHPHQKRGRRVWGRGWLWASVMGFLKYTHDSGPGGGTRVGEPTAWCLCHGGWQVVGCSGRGLSMSVPTPTPPGETHRGALGTH